MPSEKTCDFCGRAEVKLSLPAASEMPKMSQDEDGLWVCQRCQGHIISKPVGNETDIGELAKELKPLVGNSAGAICRTLELPFEPPYQAVIEAASKIAYDQDQYMSAWLFVNLWLDGTTLWASESRKQIAIVSVDGTIQIEQR